MDERTREAYQRVFTDILNRNVSLFLGRYDAVHGNDKFMHGIATVMEFIAENAGGDACLREFEDIWIDNFVESQKERNR